MSTCAASPSHSATTSDEGACRLAARSASPSPSWRPRARPPRSRGRATRSSFKRNAIALESHPDSALCPEDAEAWIAGGPELAGSVVLCTRAGGDRATVIVSLSRSKLDGRGPDATSLALIRRWWTGTSDVAASRTKDAITIDGQFALSERAAPASFMGSEELVEVKIRGTAALLR